MQSQGGGLCRCACAGAKPVLPDPAPATPAPLSPNPPTHTRHAHTTLPTRLPCLQCVFNDGVPGTAAVAVAGLYGAMAVAHKPASSECLKRLAVGAKLPAGCVWQKLLPVCPPLPPASLGLPAARGSEFRGARSGVSRHGRLRPNCAGRLPVALACSPRPAPDAVLCCMCCLASLPVCARGIACGEEGFQGWRLALVT